MKTMYTGDSSRPALEFERTPGTVVWTADKEPTALWMILAEKLQHVVVVGNCDGADAKSGDGSRMDGFTHTKSAVHASEVCDVERKANVTQHRAMADPKTTYVVGHAASCSQILELVGYIPVPVDAISSPANNPKSNPKNGSAAPASQPGATAAPKKAQSVNLPNANLNGKRNTGNVPGRRPGRPRAPLDANESIRMSQSKGKNGKRTRKSKAGGISGLDFSSNKAIAAVVRKLASQDNSQAKDRDDLIFQQNLDTVVNTRNKGDDCESGSLSDFFGGSESEGCDGEVATGGHTDEFYGEDDHASIEHPQEKASPVATDGDNGPATGHPVSELEAAMSGDQHGALRNKRDISHVIHTDVREGTYIFRKCECVGRNAVVVNITAADTLGSVQHTVSYETRVRPFCTESPVLLDLSNESGLVYLHPPQLPLFNKTPTKSASSGAKLLAAEARRAHLETELSMLLWAHTDVLSEVSDHNVQSYLTMIYQTISYANQPSTSSSSSSAPGGQFSHTLVSPNSTSRRAWVDLTNESTSTTAQPGAASGAEPQKKRKSRAKKPLGETHPVTPSGQYAKSSSSSASLSLDYHQGSGSGFTPPRFPGQSCAFALMRGLYLEEHIRRKSLATKHPQLFADTLSMNAPFLVSTPTSANYNKAELGFGSVIAVSLDKHAVEYWGRVWPVPRTQHLLTKLHMDLAQFVCRLMGVFECLSYTVVCQTGFSLKFSSSRVCEVCEHVTGERKSTFTVRGTPWLSHESRWRSPELHLRVKCDMCAASVIPDRRSRISPEAEVESNNLRFALLTSSLFHLPENHPKLYLQRHPPKPQPQPQPQPQTPHRIQHTHDAGQANRQIIKTALASLPPAIQQSAAEATQRAIPVGSTTHNRVQTTSSACAKNDTSKSKKRKTDTDGNKEEREGAAPNNTTDENDTSSDKSKGAGNDTSKEDVVASSTAPAKKTNKRDWSFTFGGKRRRVRATSRDEAIRIFERKMKNNIRLEKLQDEWNGTVKHEPRATSQNGERGFGSDGRSVSGVMGGGGAERGGQRDGNTGGWRSRLDHHSSDHRGRQRENSASPRKRFKSEGFSEGFHGP